MPADSLSGFLGEPIEDVRYTVRLDGGADSDWWVRRFRLSEAISEPYEVELDLAAQQPHVLVETEDLLGAEVVVELDRNGMVRSIQGIVHRVSSLGIEDDHTTVRLRVVPAWTYLTQHVDTRIFQDMTVPEILVDVLEPALAQYNSRKLDVSKLHADYVKRDYCVQYAESVFEFASRLMEEEGISYVFRPEQDGGVELMILTDQEDGSPNADFEDLEGLFDEEVHIITDRPETATVESIQSLDWAKPEQVNKVVVRRFNWKRPSPEPPEAEHAVEAMRGREREVYIPDDRRRVEDESGNDGYEGTEVDKDEQPMARRRVELTDREGRGHGTSNLMGMASGGVFTLADHVNPAIRGERLLVTRVVHMGESPRSGLDGFASARYRNSFECVRADDPVRPTLKTRRPRVYGPQTAIVTGPAGEEIHTDIHGRIKVRFHWDRLSAADDTSSCWVRVAQTWSGPNWGTWFVPRIGMEVLVEFLDGNPDRPLVTGTVYNGDNATPYPLPDEKTKSTIKTNSSPGGGGFNELRFEDAAGSEEIFVHAQKDFNKIVLNDRTVDIGHDHAEKIGNDRTKEVGHDQAETVGNDKSITVGGNHTESIAKNMTLAVGGSLSVSVSKNQSVSIEGSASQSVAKSKSVSVGGSSSESVDKSKSVMVTGAFDTSCDDAMSTSVKLSTTFTSGKDFSIGTDKVFNLDAKEDVNGKSGKKMNLMAGDDLNVKTDKKATITAADELTIKVGSAKLVMKKNGDILLNGAKIDIKGSGAVTVKGSSVDNN